MDRGTGEQAIMGSQSVSSVERDLRSDGCRHAKVRAIVSKSRKDGSWR